MSPSGVPASPSALSELRAMTATWASAAALPLPVLVAVDPARSADISCLYLGLASGWLVVEFYRSEGPPDSLASWRARTFAIATAVAVNVALFVSFGVAADVQTRFPFPLMAALSAIPAVGIVPWVLRRVRHPYASIILAAALVLAAKLAACVAARVVYGADYVDSHVAADWRSAKLMISLFWSFSTLLSLGLLVADYRSYIRRIESSKKGPVQPSDATGCAV